jgi:hypothetical protein
MLRRGAILLKRIWPAGAGQFEFQRWVICTDLAVSVFHSIVDREAQRSSGGDGSGGDMIRLVHQGRLCGQHDIKRATSLRHTDD